MSTIQKIKDLLATGLNKEEVINIIMEKEKADYSNSRPGLLRDLIEGAYDQAIDHLCQLMVQYEGQRGTPKQVAKYRKQFEPMPKRLIEMVKQRYN